MSELIGSSVPRLEDFSLLTGNARFVDDIPAPGALHAAFVRSPHPHALIRGIDAGAARAMPGVVAVLALDDLAPVLRQRRMVRVSNSGTKLDQSWPFALADGEVSFVGEPVAIVVASDRYIAEDAAALVAVDYDVLPAATDCRVERAPPVRRELTTNQVIAYKVAYGDSEAAFAKAAHVVHEDLWVHRGAAHSMEGRGILAQISDRETQVWASTQKAHDLNNALADYIDLDESRLRVATPDVGGGFGPKLCVYPEDVATVAAATLLRRSVKWIEDRREHFTNAAQERDQYWSIEIAADADGKVRGIRGRLIHDIGAYALQDVNIPYNSATTLSGPYMVPALAMDVVATHTNKAPVSSVRGAGYPQAAFAMERLDGQPRARDGHRARRIAPPQSDPGGEDALFEAAEGAFRRTGAIRQRRLSRLPGGYSARHGVGRFSAPPGCRARARPLHRHRAGARHQGHRPRPVRIRRRENFADRTHHGFDRRRGDGAGARHGAGANLRRGVRRARGRGHRGFRRYLRRAARPRRLRQPANGYGRFVGADRVAGRRRQGAQARQPYARSGGRGS